LAAPPIKTIQGKEELSLRTRKLSQRHRTLLLLIDGRRSREVVLDMAAQAGVPPAFFDELVSMGLVDSQAESLPDHAAESEPAPLPESVSGVDSSAPEVWSFEDVVPASASVQVPEFGRGPAHAGAEPVAESAPVSMPVAPRPLMASMRDEAIRVPVGEPVPADPVPVETTRTARIRPAGSVPDELVPTLHAAVDRPTAPAPVTAAPAPEWLPVASAPMPLNHGERVEAPVRAARVRFSAVQYPPAAPPDAARDVADMTEASGGPEPAAEAESEAEQKMLAEVRGLLIGTLLVDAPVSTSLTALRVHRTRSHAELVALVWEIERTLARAQVPREGLSRLMKARELLGLGNTQIQEDTEPGRDSR
jgi:hypothetical protein